MVLWFDDAPVHSTLRTGRGKGGVDFGLAHLQGGTGFRDNTEVTIQKTIQNMQVCR